MLQVVFCSYFYGISNRTGATQKLIYIVGRGDLAVAGLYQNGRAARKLHAYQIQTSKEAEAHQADLSVKEGRGHRHKSMSQELQCNSGREHCLVTKSDPGEKECKCRDTNAGQEEAVMAFELG